jgi:hypothetical protein
MHNALTLDETPEVSQTLRMQVTDDVELIERINKSFNEWLSILSDKLWLYTDKIDKDKVSTPTPVDPDLQNLRYRTSDNIKEYEDLVDKLFYILQKL